MIISNKYTVTALYDNNIMHVTFYDDFDIALNDYRNHEWKSKWVELQKNFPDRITILSTKNFPSLDTDGYLSVWSLSTNDVICTLEGIEVYNAIRDAIAVLLKLKSQNEQVVSITERLKNLIKN